MNSLFAVVFACLVAIAMAGRAPAPECATAKFPVGYVADTVYCLGVPLNVNGVYYNAKGTAWLGTWNKGTPKQYTACCTANP